MGKHTKGKWSVRENGGTNQAIEANGNWLIYKCGTDRMNREELEANAKLIAAAPELLEALELADAALSGANMDMKAVERNVKEAIAKARGEA